MKIKTTILISLLVTTSCSQFQEAIKDDPALDIPTTMSCEDYRKIVLESVVFQGEKLNDGDTIFVKKEKTAVAAFKAFDPKRNIAPELIRPTQPLLKRCNNAMIAQYEKDITQVKGCHITFSELNFFKGLIWGLKNYQWSEETKREARNTTYAYLKYHTSQPISLLQASIVLDVYKRLAEAGHTSAGHTAQLAKLQKETQLFWDKQKTKIKQLKSDDKLTCARVITLREEAKYGDGLGKKLNVMLRKDSP